MNEQHDLELTEAAGLRPGTDTDTLGGLWLDACEGHFEPLQWIRRDRTDEIPRSPRIPSPIAELDDWTHGGVYGLTGLGGAPGTGKSIFAQAVAYDAAASMRIPTIYLAGEMSEGQMLRRFHWIANQRGHEPDRLDEVLKAHLTVLALFNSATYDRHYQEAIYQMLQGTTEALVILDSINSVCDKLHQPGDDYWRLYRSVLNPLVTVRRITEGRLIALVVSELNQRGGTKGGRLEYDADLALNFANTQAPRVSKIRVEKNREAGGNGNLGEYRISDAARFEAMA